MSNRPGQDGSIERKGRFWHLRYLADIPGQYERKRRSAGPADGFVAPAVGQGAVTKTEARRMGRAWLTENGINSQEYFQANCSAFKPGASAQTFGDRVKFWDEHIKPTLQPRSQAGMSCAANKYMLPLLKDYPLTSLDSDAAQRFVTALTKTINPQTKKVLNAKTVHVYFGHLKAILGTKICRDWEVRLPEIPFKEQFWFTPDHTVQLITHSEGVKRVLLIILAETGTRINEALGLHVEDIDFDAQVIKAQRSVLNSGEAGPMKTKKGYRLIYISALAVQVLKAHLQTEKITSGIVFRSESGGYMCDSNLRDRWFNPLVKKLGIPQPKGSAFHALRHGRVSALKSAGVGDDVVLSWIGHSTLEMSLHYTHKQAEEGRTVADRVSQLSQVVTL